MQHVRVLHLAGSPVSTFFYDLSLTYARGCFAALGNDTRYTFVNAIVDPDGMWRFPLSLEAIDIDRAECVTFSAAVERIARERVDIGLPQMFCVAGMTHYRAVFELLGIPYLGNRPLQMAIAADKAKTRAIVAAAGVDVPPAELLRPGDVPSLAPPVVVKPTTSDNSDGISLVTLPTQYGPAVDEAFRHSDTVLVERYVELGREVRAGIVVRDGHLVCLPLEEYYVDPVLRPIRTREHKLKRDGNAFILAAKEATQSWIVAPDDPIVPAVWEAARKSHVALGCEQYSLFDFRIDPEGRPWFLEAGLYCSFSPQSVIVMMANAAGISLPNLFARAIEEAMPVTKRRGR